MVDTAEDLAALVEEAEGSVEGVIMVANGDNDNIKVEEVSPYHKNEVNLYILLYLE